MNNSTIADNFSLLAKLIDIHGENSFKSKSYSNAAFTIDKLPAELAHIPEEKIQDIKGIGDAIAKKITQQLETGELLLLNEYIQKTPLGVMEMLKIKGLGAKKIATIWKELEVETIGELLYACNENRLMLYKGFGEKTQQNIKESIEFYLRSQGSYLFAEIIGYANELTRQLQTTFTHYHFSLTGAIRRNMEIIEQIEWITTMPAAEIKNFFATQQIEATTATPEVSEYKSRENAALRFYHATTANQFAKLFITSCSQTFCSYGNNNFHCRNNTIAKSLFFSRQAYHSYLLFCVKVRLLLACPNKISCLK